MTATRAAIAFLMTAACAGSACADDAVIQPANNVQAVQVLSAADAERYREIFADERAGHFDKATALMNEVSDPSLKGYVEAEHFLSPHSKRASVAELIDWLREYRELAIADRIYRLAVKRSTKKVRHHHHVTLVAVVTNIPAPAGMPRMRGGGYEDVNLPDPPLSSEAARSASGQINAAIKSDQPDQAMAILQPLIDSNAIPPSDAARLSQHIAASYFTEGLDQKAYDLAARVPAIDRLSAPMLDWNAGLAAFRLGMFHDSAQYFETLAQVGSVSNYVRAGAAFWAARAHARAGEPGKVITLLGVAAREEPTFYGLLAEQMLGQDTQFGFSDPVVDPDNFARLMQIPAAHRAAALAQVGERGDADEELQRAFGESDPKLDPTLVALARQVGAPSIEMRASETSASRGIKLTGLFPIPPYKPEGGYTIDPALVLAIIRQESRFHPAAVSGPGARGLMQIMPGTATHIAGAGAASQLNDPSYNMTIGQRYVAELLNTYNGNLVKLCAAYDAGVLKVSNWETARAGKGDDALLFIESMHAPETRLYVKRVLTYYWMYRRRLGLNIPALTDTAAGDWPIYHPPHQPAPPPPPAPAPEDNDDNDAQT